MKASGNIDDKVGKKYNLEYFFELSPDLLCIAGFDGYFKRINPAVSKTLGYTEEELFARPINSFVYPDDQDVTSRKRDMIRHGSPLLHFENRYVTKTGEIVWLTWTSMPIRSEKVVFAIAKNITYKKRLEEYHRLLELLGYTKGQKAKRLDAAYDEQGTASWMPGITLSVRFAANEQSWLSEVEKIVRKYTGKTRLDLRMLSNELCISERQLHRRIKAVMGVTPNKFIRIIRMQIAREAIADGKGHSAADISKMAGFETPAYFKKLFRQTYDAEITG